MVPRRCLLGVAQPIGREPSELEGTLSHQTWCLGRREVVGWAYDHGVAKAKMRWLMVARRDKGVPKNNERPDEYVLHREDRVDTQLLPLLPRS